jgi:pfkB family carbohydrate kinase
VPRARGWRASRGASPGPGGPELANGRWPAADDLDRAGEPGRAIPVNDEDCHPPPELQSAALRGLQGAPAAGHDPDRVLRIQLSGAAVEGVEPAGEEVAGRAAAAARGLVARGANRAIVSAGSHGVAFSDATGTAFCPAPQVSVVSPIGAGDALGGLVQALEQGRPWPAAVGYAVAAVIQGPPNGRCLRYISRSSR